jgi:hypothetical protein
MPPISDNSPVRRRLWLVVPALIFSLVVGLILVPMEEGNGVQELYGIFYAGFMYVAVRLIYDGAKRNRESEYIVGLALMSTAPFLSVLGLVIFDVFIHPL